MKKYKALIAEIIIAAAVLFSMDFSNLQPINYMIIFFMVITLVFGV